MTITTYTPKPLKRWFRSNRWVLLGVLVVVALAIALRACTPSVPEARASDAATLNVDLERFATTIDTIREALLIPGMSAGIARDGELIWAQGFGSANVDAGIPATAGTPYGLASVTKPFAAILLMKKVEEGLLDLDAPVADFGIFMGDDITVRHLLSHTSEGTPGDAYSYSGGRYSNLTRIIEQLYGASFRQVLRQQILVPLGMNDTVLNHGSASLDYYLSTLADDDPELAFEHVYRDAALPYQYDSSYAVYPVSVPSYANSAAGLISSVEDLARFAGAIADDALVSATTKMQMFSPTRLNSGAAGPYGLGWFTETVDGLDLIWHYGYGAYSVLFLMVPSEGLTFIALANTQNLSRPFRLGNADVSVLASPLGLEFYKQFIVQPQQNEPLPVIDWGADENSIAEQLSQIEDASLRTLYEDELWTYRKLYAGVGRMDVGAKLLTVHRASFPEFERTATDLYQVGLISPQSAPIDSIALTQDEQSRWLGHYTLRANDVAGGLPLDVSIQSVGGEILIVPTDDNVAQVLYAETATRLRVPDNPDLALVAREEEGAFNIIDVEYAGERAGTYERTD